MPKRRRPREEGADPANAQHPFVDRAQLSDLVTGPFSLYSDSGDLIAVLIRQAYPSKVANLAAQLLRKAPRGDNMRAAIHGGHIPLTGLAGYYDYTGTPLTFKCRKTSFTHTHLEAWPCVFPLIEYLNTIYKVVAPVHWQAQNQAIPDPVRIHRSVFSTLTVNQRFRTAAHTDVGDYDEGMGVLTVLEGIYEGMHLSLPDFDISFDIQPRDVLIFDTHYLHCNTEPELPEWDRLVCVLYYRVKLGGQDCWQQYRRRKDEHDQNSALVLSSNPVLTVSQNLRKVANVRPLSVMTICIGAARSNGASLPLWLTKLQNILNANPGLHSHIFAESPFKTAQGWPCIMRPADNFVPLDLQNQRRPKKARLEDTEARGDTDLLVTRFLEDLDDKASTVVQPLLDAVKRFLKQVASACQRQGRRPEVVGSMSTDKAVQPSACPTGSAPASCMETELIVKEPTTAMESLPMPMPLPTSETSAVPQKPEADSALNPAEHHVEEPCMPQQHHSPALASSSPQPSRAGSSPLKAFLMSIKAVAQSSGSAPEQTGEAGHKWKGAMQHPLHKVHRQSHQSTVRCVNARPPLVVAIPLYGMIWDTLTNRYRHEEKYRWAPKGSRKQHSVEFCDKSHTHHPLGSLWAGFKKTTRAPQSKARWQGWRHSAKWNAREMNVTSKFDGSRSPPSHTSDERFRTSKPYLPSLSMNKFHRNGWNVCTKVKAKGAAHVQNGTKHTSHTFLKNRYLRGTVASQGLCRPAIKPYSSAIQHERYPSSFATSKQPKESHAASVVGPVAQNIDKSLHDTLSDDHLCSSTAMSLVTDVHSKPCHKEVVVPDTRCMGLENMKGGGLTGIPPGPEPEPSKDIAMEVDRDVAMKGVHQDTKVASPQEVVSQKGKRPSTTSCHEHGPISNILSQRDGPCCKPSSPKPSDSDDDIVELHPCPMPHLATPKLSATPGPSAIQGSKMKQSSVRPAKGVAELKLDRKAKEALNEVFQMCDLPAYGGEGLMNLLIGATHLSAGQRDQFWGALLRYIHMRAQKEFGIPDAAFDLETLLEVFQGYNERCMRCVDVRFEDPLKTVMDDQKTVNWLYIDSFDYQTEDREVQWDLEGIPRPLDGLPVPLRPAEQVIHSSSNAPRTQPLGNPTHSHEEAVLVTVICQQKHRTVPSPEDLQAALQKVFQSISTDDDCAMEYLRVMCCVLHQHFFLLQKGSSVILTGEFKGHAVNNEGLVKQPHFVDPTVLGGTNHIVATNAAKMPNMTSSKSPSAAAKNGHADASADAKEPFASPSICDRPPYPDPPSSWCEWVDALGNSWRRPNSLPDLFHLLLSIAPQLSAAYHGRGTSIEDLVVNGPSKLQYQELTFDDITGPPQSQCSHCNVAVCAPSTSALSASPASSRHIVVVIYPHLLEATQLSSTFQWAHDALHSSGFLVVKEFDLQCREYYRLQQRWQHAWDTVAHVVLRTFEVLTGAKQEWCSLHAESEQPTLAGRQYQNRRGWQSLIESFGFSLRGVHYAKGDALGTMHLVFSKVLRSGDHKRPVQM